MPVRASVRDVYKRQILHLIFFKNRNYNRREMKKVKEKFLKLNPFGLLSCISVSYTHLDVYKRQLEGILTVKGQGKR